MWCCEPLEFIQGGLDNLGHPYTHPLGETFSTLAPIRYGKYVAKVSLCAAFGESQAADGGKHVDAGHGFNPWKRRFVNSSRPIRRSWQVQAQLAVDPETTPIEDASKEWPEDKAPWQPVGTITVLPQESYSDARQIFFDERISFSPWHGLSAHQPLGGIYAVAPECLRGGAEVPRGAQYAATRGAEVRRRSARVEARPWQ